MADRVQIQALNQLQEVVLVRRITQANAQPFGFGLTWFGAENSKFAGQ